MKAAISSTGVLTITTDNETEAYALAQWQKNSLIQMDDQQRNEKWHYKGSSIKLAFVNSNVDWMVVKDADEFKDKKESIDHCGVIIEKNGIPKISGLRPNNYYYRCRFVADNGASFCVDGATDDSGTIEVTTWSGEAKSGDVVKLTKN